MPSKKLDPVKRGDITMAHFVYDGDSRTESTSPQQKHTTPGTQADSSQLGEKEKDKDKEKEKDKKEKDGAKESVTIEDLNLPKSIITRLAKGVLPSNTQIQANAILAMSKGATVFINHLANAANEHTQNNNKKTIMPSDVFEALGDIEFPFFRERLEAEFKKFNDTQTTKRNTYRRRVAAQKKADKANTSTMSASADDAAPRAKKLKTSARHEESAMDVDGDEPRDASDADTEPEPEQEEEDEEDEQEESEQEEDEENEEEEAHDRLEEKRRREDEDDDALDHSGDSD